MSTAPKRTAIGVAPSTPLAMAEWAIEGGLWPVAIHPYDAKVASPGKAPIGNRWGAERPDLASIRSTFRRYPKANVGLKLGADGGIIDIDVDQPDPAGETIARLFPDGLPETLRWSNAQGKYHLAFRYDARLAALGKTIIKGVLKPDGEIGGNPAYLGLEVRIGAPSGDPRQLQTVVPPSLMANGAPRRWTKWGDLLALPEHVVQDLLANASSSPIPTAPARRADALKGARPEDGRWTPEARAAAYLLKCEPAVSGQDGHGKAFKAACKAGPGFDLHPDTLLRLLRDVWNPTCEPPWSDRELLHKVEEAYRVETRRGWLLEEGRSASKDRNRSGDHAPAPGPTPRFNVVGADGPLDEGSERFNPTDTGNSLRLVRDHGDKLRYCVEWGKWLRWDGRRWKEDKTGGVYRLARKTIRKIGAEAAASDDPDDRKILLKWAVASESRKHVDAMIHLARFVEGIPVETSQLDRDPWLLNVANGTIDLRTGELRAHRREDLITKLADVEYDPNAPCNRWDRFELEIMDNNKYMVQYIRRIAGYCITGDVREHQLYFFHGEGRNGKSLWLNIIHRLLGDYSTTINSSLITVKQHEDHPTGLTDLEGRRFVSTIEVADGRKMAEALVKQLTGSDPIKARRMRQDHYSFMPTHKIILAANHKPDIRETGEAIWERVKLIPFPVTFVEEDRVDPSQKRLLKDKALEEALWAESSGILATLVRGCLEWQKGGMNEPDLVVQATAGYRAEMDRLTDFIGERCIVAESVRVKSNALYEAYKSWAKASGENEMTKRKFGSNLERRGFINKSSNSVWWRHGIALNDSNDDQFQNDHRPY